MSITVSSPPSFPKAVAVPAASPQSHHNHALNLALSSDQTNHSLLLLTPPQKPSSPRVPEEPFRHPPRSTEKNGYPRTLPRKSRPRSRSSAIDVLRLMDGLSIPVPPETYSSLVKECTLTGDSDEALELHRHLKRSGLRPDLVLLNRLLLMHVSCGCMRLARQLFDEMPQRDLLSWSVLFAAFMEDGDYIEAIQVFLGIWERFRSSEVSPWIVGCVLKACAYTMNVELGMQIHGWILKTGSSNRNPIPIRLLDFYGKFRYGNYANTVFDQLKLRDSVAWTAKIASGCRKRQFREVVNDFQEMSRRGMKISSRMISSALKASGRIGDGGNCGKQIHSNAIKLGMEAHELVQHGLVDMYVKSGLLLDARRVYDEIRVDKRKKIVCSNAMIKGYLRYGFSVEAIKLLHQMKAEGIPCSDELLDKVRVLSGS